MPKYTNKKTGQTFNSPKELTPEQLEELFSKASEPQGIKETPNLFEQAKPLIYDKVVSAIQDASAKWKQAIDQLISSGAKTPSIRQATPYQFDIPNPQKYSAGNINMLGAGIKGMSVPFAPAQGTPIQPLIDLGMLPGNLMWGGIKAVSPPMNPEMEEALGGVVPAIGSMAAWGGVGKLGKIAKPGIMASAERARARTATKIGALAGAGENIPMARRAGQFIAEENIPIAKKAYEKTPQGLTPVSKGAKMAREKVQQLNEELNTKIINPTTEAGAIFEAKPIYDAATQLFETAKKEFLPNRTLLRSMERELELLKETIDKNNGMLTPRQAQDFKVKNNALLSEIYKKRDRGTLTERQEARESILLEGNAQLRKMLESLDPQIKGINWTEGAGLEVAKSLDKYLEYRMSKDPAMVRGSGITGAAMGRARLATLFFASELALFRPFRIWYNKILNKTATKISGVKSEFTRGVNPPTTPIPLDAIPPSFKRTVCEELGIPIETPDAQVIAIAKWKNKYENAPTEEAPVSRGGSMNVRGEANEAQINKFKK